LNRTAVELSGKMYTILTVFTEMDDAYGGAMNNIGESAEPSRELVEYAIVEVLRIARRQGITPADFIRMLDSGMRTSDFLTTMDPLTNADHSMDSDFS
jgi:hypothetical protein